MKDADPFVATLDYVFCSPGDWAVTGVKATRKFADVDATKPYPTEDQPSDHCMIAADLEMKR